MIVDTQLLETCSESDDTTTSSTQVTKIKPLKNDFDHFLKQLESCTASTKKQIKTVQILLDSELIFEKYVKHSPQCRELFEFLDETIEEINELLRSNQPLNLNETNADIVLQCVEKVCIYYQNKVKQFEELSTTTTTTAVLLTDKNDLKVKFTSLCTLLVSDKYIKLLTRCLKMRSGTKKTIELQETCVRLLTICLNQNVDFAKKIALEYDCFNEFKNWLERFLLMRQTNLRESSVQFLISFFKYVHSSEQPAAADLAHINIDREYLIIIKKIFLNENSKKITTTTNNNNKTSKKGGGTEIPVSSLLNCLFSHVGTDTFDSIEFLLQELLFKLVQNELFNKSEKVKFFNEKTLTNLIKLYEWIDKSTKNNQTLIVHQMINEFLKVLFCSTRYGINFYDRSLNIDQSDKNYNHLIFNALIAINRHTNDKETNEMIDDLLLRTLKVCPDLIQRFLKVKQKQESLEWFIHFSTRLFEQQLICIKMMKQSSQISNTSYLRSIATVSSDETSSFLCNLIIATSMPLCLSFQKSLTTATTTTSNITNYNQTLSLLIASLKCIKEWKECLRYYELNQKQFKLNSTDLVHSKINENLKKAFDNQSSINLNENLNLELLTKYLPKFDTFCDSNVVKQLTDNDLDLNSSIAIVNSFEVFNLYFDIFMTTTSNSEDLVGNCFNLLQIETLDQSLVKIIPVLLSLSSDNLTKSNNNNNDNNSQLLTVCLKYLKFLIKYSSLKQTESCLDDLDSATTNDLTTTTTNDMNLKIINNETYLIDYKNLNILNLIKIMFKFRDESSFKLLTGYYLNLIGVYLKSDEDQNNTIYLWLLLIKKHFADHTTQMKSNELNVYIDYIYFCLNNILNLKQRNLIKFQMNLNNNDRDEIKFNQLFVFICLRNYLVLNDLVSKQHGMQLLLRTPLDKISSFLFDYILCSSLMFENSDNNNSLDDLFDKYFTNKLLLNNDNNIMLMSQMNKKLKTKLNDIVSSAQTQLCSESFMINFEQASNLINFKSDKSVSIIDLNFNLRISHLLFLTVLVINQVNKFSFYFLNVLSKSKTYLR